MYSFFFIPSTKVHKLRDLRNLGISEFVIDFEDAIKASERENLVNTLSKDNDLLDCYLRLPVYDESETVVSIKFLIPFLEAGFKKFVIPKLNSRDDLDILISQTNSYNISIVILIETPRLYLELLSGVSNYKSCIEGIALGSHDFMSVVGGTHTLNNLEILRQNILYMARAIDSIAIDIASMELNNLENFGIELIDGFNKGFDAKFLIHPKQFKVFNEHQFYTEAEYLRALKIVSYLKEVNGINEEFNPIVVDGQIIERPHIERALKIVSTYKK